MRKSGRNPFVRQCRNISIAALNSVAMTWVRKANRGLNLTQWEISFLLCVKTGIERPDLAVFYASVTTIMSQPHKNTRQVKVCFVLHLRHFNQQTHPSCIAVVHLLRHISQSGPLAAVRPAV